MKKSQKSRPNHSHCVHCCSKSGELGAEQNSMYASVCEVCALKLNFSLLCVSLLGKLTNFTCVGKEAIKKKIGEKLLLKEQRPR